MVGDLLADLLDGAVQVTDVGIASPMTSPSVLTTKRSTPWVLGCCGPTLMVISSV